jgi:4-amino-4-deoxy-L-arabinose transferase-like glycosyltransferase
MPERIRPKFVILIDTLCSVPEWIWLVIVATPIRLFNLSSESLWYDESFTAWLSSLPFDRMMQTIKGDVHPPLFYILEWGLVHIWGRSEFVLRFPSAILGILVVLLCWRMATLLLNRPTAFMAGILAAILPAGLYYSQEARMYALLSFFVLCAAISAIKEQWVYLALAGIGAIYTQNLAAFYLIALAGAILLPRLTQPRAFGPPFAAFLAVGLVWLPWGLTGFLEQIRGVGSGFWIQPLTLGGALMPLATMTMGWRIPDSLQIHAYALAFALTMFGLVMGRVWLLTRRGLIILAVMLGAPTLAAVVSIIWRSIYLNRAFLPSAFTLCLLWACPLTMMNFKNRRIAWAVALPIIVIGVFAHFFPAPNSGRFDMRSWIAPIRAAWQPGDVVWYVANDSAVLAGYYLDLPWRIFPYSSDLSQSLTDETKQAMGFRSATFESLSREGFKRAWVLVAENPMTSAMQIEEIERLRTIYRPKVIETFDNTISNQALWLIEL